MEWSPDEVMTIALCCLVAGFLLGATMVINVYEEEK